MVKDVADASGADNPSQRVDNSVSEPDSSKNNDSVLSESAEPPAANPKSIVASDDTSGVTSTLQSTAPVSQPMTASNSSSSINSTKDASADAVPSPYGTRSRNRGGASRPNYAEDREMEAEYDVQPSAKEETSKKNSRSGDMRSSLGGETAVASGASRRGPLAAVEHDYNEQATMRDHIPGTSSFSANPINTSQPSKKRKSAGQASSGTSNTSGPPNGTISGSQPATRRASLAMQAGTHNKDDSAMLSFDNYGARLNDGKLKADDGTVLEVNDHVYLVCEPPGEPYYLGRIMEFLHVANDPEKPIDALRLNWYYRPKDIGRKVTDTRQVFASMHSDISPLTALRGSCQIKHRSEIGNLEEFKNNMDCFWYEKLFDRYIHRYYEVIPTSKVVNVPAHVKRVLDERWRFILVESGRGKELTSAVKSCKRCAGFCASNDSVDCAVCRQTYHMDCVRPPLLKKPSRGFAWACGPCSRAQERKLEARNTPNVASHSGDDEEMVDEEDDEAHLVEDPLDTERTSPERSNDVDTEFHPGTAEQIHQASLWPYRYLGLHCKVEDALDYDDRIYPRASSRLGPRHQANVTAWPGRPVEYVKPMDMKRKYTKGGSHKKEVKLSRENVIALEADKVAREQRPKWVMDEPVGYVARGEDYDNDDPRNTAQLLYKGPEFDEEQSPTTQEGIEAVDKYKESIETVAKKIGVPKFSVNLIDKALSIYQSAHRDSEVALQELEKVDKKQLGEPELTPAEIKKFEDGIAKFGSELHSVKRHVKTVSAANIVRFYYAWKKTDRGKQVWGNYSGRKGKKEAKKVEATANAGKLQDDVADDQDDSAFDNDKAAEKKRGFQCKFCSTRTSRQWRRAPGTSAGTMIPADPNFKPTGKDKGPQLMVALCLSCAVVWRKYAVQRDEPEDKKPALSSGRGNKRKIDDAQREFQINEITWTANNTDTATTPNGGTPIPQSVVVNGGQEPARKKVKGSTDKDSVDPTSLEVGSNNVATQQKKKIVEKPPGPPPPPAIPKPRPLPCAICQQMEPFGEQRLCCRECRMTVHRNCYGAVGETRTVGKWVCDTCTNDRSPQVSTDYFCVLCPVRVTEADFVGPIKVSHKKKAEKDRERDRLDRETAIKTADHYYAKQIENNRPGNPREPLKRSANNNWVHVTCAVFTPEVKFAQAKALELCEGIPLIPSTRYDDVCKACEKTGGACVHCHTCRAPVHVECAHQSGYVLGFDIAPVKGSRRDHVNIVTVNGEAGTMTAQIWCKEHMPTKTIVHKMHDIVDETGLNALQLYVQNFKQADLTLTGTVRKATLVNQSTKAQNPPLDTSAPGRRVSASGQAVRAIENGGYIETTPNDRSQKSLDDESRTCVTCHVEFSPKWWPYFPTLQDNPESSVQIPTSDHAPSSESRDSRYLENGQHLTNGNSQLNHAESSPKPLVALAQPESNKNTEENSMAGKEVQCHKCHHRKIRKPLPVAPPPLVPAQLELNHSRPSEPTPAPPAPVLGSPSSARQSDPRYSWPQGHPSHQRHPSHPSHPAHPVHAPHPAYSPPRAWNSWSRPSPGPSQPHNPPRHYDGSRSPQGNTPLAQHANGQQPVHHATANMPPSPRYNATFGSQVANGYPVSPHRPLSGPHQPQNVGFTSYSTSRPPPHHLTNGGPPPRAPENPFSRSQGPLHRHTSYETTHASPQINREPPLLMRESHQPHPPHNSRPPNDGRVNGGASASPSLRNLLS